MPTGRLARFNTAAASLMRLVGALPNLGGLEFYLADWPRSTARTMCCAPEAARLPANELTRRSGLSGYAV